MLQVEPGPLTGPSKQEDQLKRRHLEQSSLGEPGAWARSVTAGTERKSVSSQEGIFIFTIIRLGE